VNNTVSFLAVPKVLISISVGTVHNTLGLVDEMSSRTVEVTSRFGQEYTS
jgi:hypothetical protein